MEGNKDSSLLFLELKSELVVSLTNDISTAANDDENDNEETDSVTWSNQELPRYNNTTNSMDGTPSEHEDGQQRQPVTSDFPSQLPVPDSVQELIQSYLKSPGRLERQRREQQRQRQAGLRKLRHQQQKKSLSSCSWKGGDKEKENSLLVVRGVILIGIHLLYGDLTLKSRWIRLAQQTFGTCSSNDKTNNNDNESDNNDKREHLNRWQSLKETQLVWNEIKEVCSFANWTVLLSCLSQHVVIFGLQHPLHEYAQHVVPILSIDEKKTVCETLKLFPSSSLSSSSSPTKNMASTSTTSSAAAVASSLSSSSNVPSYLAVVKAIQNKFEPQLVYAILLNPEEAKQLPHSCMPNGSLRANYSNGTLQVVVSSSSASSPSWQNKGSGGHEHSNKNNLNGQCSLCRIQDNDVEEREEEILLLTGHSCGCLRCRYELENKNINDRKDPSAATTATTNNDNNNHIQLDTKDLMTLGHFYLAGAGLASSKHSLERQQNLAQQIFQVARFRNVQNWNAWHALAAIELSRNRFLAAQQIWMEAKQQYNKNKTQTLEQQQQGDDDGVDDKRNDREGKDPAENDIKSSSGNDIIISPHDGLTLQWTKLDAYEYLSSLSSSSSTTSTVNNYIDKEETSDNGNPTTKQQVGTSQRVVTHVFRTTNMVTPNDCQQIIQWAKDGKWTEKRHYAVPTKDVPVHVVPMLLSWFRPWFTNVVCPLLAQQFHTTTKNYYVHDAFVVKYEATLKSNYLPLHTDESTHSFVLALNDNYEGGGTNLLAGDEDDDNNVVIRLQTGEMLSFRGDLIEHGGEPVTKGTRYIIAGFLYYDDECLEKLEGSSSSTSGNVGWHPQMDGNKNNNSIVDDSNDNEFHCSNSNNSNNNQKKRAFQEIRNKDGDDESSSSVAKNGNFSFAFKIEE